MSNRTVELIKEECMRMRAMSLQLEITTRELAKELFPMQVHNPSATPGLDPKEAGAQAMLAVRHLEDARMRLGKVMQYLRDGVSSYDKEQLP